MGFSLASLAKVESVDKGNGGEGWFITVLANIGIRATVGVEHKAAIFADFPPMTRNQFEAFLAFAYELPPHVN